MYAKTEINGKTELNSVHVSGTEKCIDLNVSMTNEIAVDQLDRVKNKNKNDNVNEKNIADNTGILVTDQLVEVDDVGFEDVYAEPVMPKELDIYDPDGNEHFFEGAEKRLVIYFNNSNVRYNLRNITRAEWEAILDIVNCRILSVISNDYYDAYLLSESSLFVTRNGFLLKTCGSTTLLNCLELLLKTIVKYGFDAIQDVFYSHKNFLLPSLQSKPHNSFFKENEYLQKVFNGCSHIFGHINSDRWYLYTKDYCTGVGQTLNGHYLSNNEHYKFEMIMEELDPDCMRIFFNDGTNTAAEVTRISGIDSIIPGLIIDDYLFSPCGYSMNGLVDKHYLTIHITPEPDFSYVSIETNLPQKSYAKFIGNLIKLFKPGKFMLNIFVPSINYVKSQITTFEQSNSFTDRNGTKEYSFYKILNNHETEDETANIQVNGLKIYEELCCGPFDFKSIGLFRCNDFQMAHIEHLDIIYARYVNEGIS